MSQMPQNWIAQCEQCGIQYPNHAGSTPCCGSLAFIVEPDAIELSPERQERLKANIMDSVNEEIGKQKLRKKLTDMGVFEPKKPQQQAPPTPTR